MSESALAWEPPQRDIRLPQRAWTEADLAALPDDANTYEVLNGKLTVSPPPEELHQGIGLHIAADLLAAAPSGWRVRYEIGLRLPNGNVIPDIVVLRPDAPRRVVWTDAMHVALVLETASRSTADYDAGEKALAYAKAGIPFYWRVEPGGPGSPGGVHLFTLDENGDYVLHATVHAGESATVAEPFPVTVAATRWLDPD